MCDAASIRAELKKRSLAVALAASVLLVTLDPACGADTATAVVVKESDAGKSVEISVGRKLVVQLPAQLGTGFRWTVDPTSASVVKLVQATTQNETGAPGRAEIQRFVFSAVQVGSGTLSFSYRRPWEKDQPPAKVFTVSVRVAARSS